MPLRKAPKGASKATKQKVASRNIREMHKAHPEMPHEQHVAAGLRAAGVARKARAKKRR